MKKKYIAVPLVAATLSLSGCMDTIEPTDVASKDQVNMDSEAFGKLVNGLKSKMIQLDTYGSEVGSFTEAVADWGYPCYMLWRDILLDGMPTTGSAWNYQRYFEGATSLTYCAGYPYYYYYSFINNANRIIASRSEEGAPEGIKQSLAITRTYRALSYFHLTMMYEYFKTGIDELDQKAAANGVMGLTVPLVTENTTADESKNNPRVPFYTMYKFIYNDLKIAEENIGSYARSDKNDINEDVINGIMARFWMAVGSRFLRYPEDLQTQLDHESDGDYAALGVTSANDCFAKAAEYAEKVVAAGYSPVTSDQWHDASTGFNTANQAWVWDFMFSSTEQTPRYWMTITGTLAIEPTWAFPAYTKEYRCISKKLYDKMPDADWRKTTWVGPDDAGAVKVPSKYETTLKDETAATISANTQWSRLPAYSSLKYRAASMDSEEQGLLTAIPLMRVEEMYFIEIEAALRTSGLAAAKSQLESFLNTYRYTDGSYVCNATNADDFITEMIAQKYIEFWGEDVMFNDYKRLGLQIDRTGADNNYLEAYQLKSKAGYVAPWLNFYISDVEKSFNKAVVMNPDPTDCVKMYCK